MTAVHLLPTDAMMMQVLTTLLLASAGASARNTLSDEPTMVPTVPTVPAQDVCEQGEALKARRDTEVVRAIVGFATLFVFVVPFLPVSLGANVMVRDETSDRRYNRLLDLFEGDRPAFKAHLEDVCALDVSLEHLRDGASVTRPFALISVIVGTVEVVALALSLFTAYTAASLLT